MLRRALPSILTLTALALLSSLGRSQIHTWHGEEAGDDFGASVDRIGDIDGDGRDDLIVGAPHLTAIFGGSASYARVFSGRTGALLYEDRDDTHDDHRGRTVRGIGDWSGDGVPDYMVCSASERTHGSLRPAARIFSGADGTLIVELHVDSWHADSWQSASGAGDVNADGFADVILGEPRGGRPGSENGMAHVYAGPTGTLVRTFIGEGDDELLGMDVAGVGDWNGDGRDDVAISTGIQHADVYSAVDGQWLFHVNTGGELGDPGDFDGDGQRDLLVGGTVFSGYESDPLLVMTGWAHHVPAGDRSCDGVLDFLVSYPGYGRVGVLSGVDGSVLEILYEAGGGAGAGLALVGDVDGDGILDVLIGSPGNYTEGAARLLTGYSPPPPTNYCIGAPNSAGLGAEMGFAGSTEIASNDLRLLAHGCPQHQTGIFFYGPTAIQNAFGHGYMCVGGWIHRLGPPVSTGPEGTAAYEVDFELPPMSSGPGEIIAGSTWRFQFWYRDAMAGGGSFNLTDGLAITFCQ